VTLPESGRAAHAGLDEAVPHFKAQLRYETDPVDLLTAPAAPVEVGP
jgi:hypothetical protein